jgi:hypothetical protein
MSRGFLALNVVFVTLALAAAAFSVYELRAPTPKLPAPARASAPPVMPPAVGPGPPSSPGAYGVVASRNLFSPSRSEAPPTPAATGPTATVTTLNLYGVVLRDGAPIAYIEDPVTKRVSGYRLGDTIGGGSVQAIATDHVVIARPEGSLDVRLHDPARPRPALPAPTLGQPGTAAGQGGTMQAPGVVPGAGTPVVPGPMPPAAEVQPAPPPGTQLPAPAPGRRLSPNLLRRFPPVPDAPQR